METQTRLSRHNKFISAEDWKPLKHQSLCNRKDNDKDALEINSDQLDSGYHRDKER